MKVFLLWHRNGDFGQDLDPYRVASSLQKQFSPLFSCAPTVRIRENAAAAFVCLELPVRGWKPTFFQEDARTWACAVDYPIDARPVLQANGIVFEEDYVLPALGRALRGNPAPFIREMAPPFSMLWGSKDTAEMFVQNDGLGQSQLFEYQDGRFWAITNKIVALKALGVSLELDYEQWAVRTALSWFPSNLTGFKKLRFLDPSTQLHLNQNGVHRTTCDILSEWVNPDDLSLEECRELARCSLIDQIKAAMPLWEKPSAGLTGGWDSRAVIGTLRTLSADFTVRVKGQPEKFDVPIASELAKIAGLDLEIRTSYGLPPEDADDCKRCISLALLWQMGYMWSEEHKSFLWEKRCLDGGQVNIMGQHGEIGRGTYEKAIRAWEVTEEQYEELLVQLLTKDMPSFMRTGLRERVYEIVREAYRFTGKYGCTGPARLDLFRLYERTRRRNSGSLNSQTGLVFAPFLNPNYIRATFAYRRQGGAFYDFKEQLNPFHRHIIATNAPDWANVTYADVLEGREKKRRIKEALAMPQREPVSVGNWKQSNGKDYYNFGLYWKVVGKPIIDAAISQGGFWTEVFDPLLAEKEWHNAPDDLAMLHLIPQVL